MRLIVKALRLYDSELITNALLFPPLLGIVLRVEDSE